MQLRQKCDGDGPGADESPPSSTTFGQKANPRQRVEAANNTQENECRSQSNEARTRTRLTS